MWTASARHQYRRSGGRDATDVSDAEFALIEPLLPRAKHGGRRRTTVLREVLNALLYLLRTGCPWRMLPRGFPPRSTVYGYFRRFWQEGVWSTIQATRAWQRGSGPAARSSRRRRSSPARASRRPKPAARAGSTPARRSTAASVDLLTDTLGLPLRLVVHPVSIQDRDGLALICTGIRRRFPSAATPLGDRAHLRLARPQPQARQRLRTADRHIDRHGRPRHHPTAHAPPGKALIRNQNFSNGL